MTAAKFKTAIAKLGLSQERAGEWLGVSARQGQRWASGEAKVPKAESMLLRLMTRLNLKPEDVK